MGYLQERFTAMVSDQGKSVVKHEFYADIYEQWLTPFVNKEITLIEIGTGRGGSLQVWKAFLGPKAMIYGLDRSDVLFYEEDRIKHFKADQFNRESLEAVPIRDISIFIDDASHNSRGQINTFEVFFPRMRPKGLYIVEDVGTSYRANKEYEGGYRKPGSFIEYCKDIVEMLYINEWGELIPTIDYMLAMTSHFIPNNNLFKTVESVTFYNGIVIIKKK